MSGEATSERCTATSKRTGRRCGQLVPAGGPRAVCKWHGGAAPQVEAQRQVRLALAEVKQDLFAGRYEARHWTESLAAAAALADQQMQALRDKIELSGNLNATDMAALAEQTERTARLARLCQTAGLDEARAELDERTLAQMLELLTNVLGDLGLSLQEPRVQRVLAERLEPLALGGGS